MFVEDPKAKFTQPIEPQATPACDPFSLEALIAWLERQPANLSYNYGDWRGCLLAKYTIGSGGSFTPCDNYQIGGQILPALGSDLAIFVARPMPQTMGGALSRARKLQAREACGSKASI